MIFGMESLQRKVFRGNGILYNNPRTTSLFAIAQTKQAIDVNIENHKTSNEVNKMDHSYWSNWYFGWGWFLWFGVWFLLISSIGNWGYSYRAHQKFNQKPYRTALDILNERYARGEIKREDYGVMKSELSK
jgi:putative membrane protein